MKNHLTPVTTADYPGVTEMEGREIEKAPVDPTGTETADQGASDERSGKRWRARFRHWLRKVWEQECPLLPNDYFDNHGN